MSEIDVGAFGRDFLDAYLRSGFGSLPKREIDLLVLQLLRLSPLDGIGPKELGLDQLRERLKSGEINELILAMTTTVEGEATAHYISEMAEGSVDNISRIAHGVPLGGELEYVDSGTLAHAFAGRQRIINK